MVVSAGDPRENLQNFTKIGEGSTGTVCIATDKSTGKFCILIYVNGLEPGLFVRGPQGGHKGRLA